MPPTLETPAPTPTQPARWTIRRLLRWIREEFGRDLGRETLRRVLHALGLSWKKGKKLLAKADPVARAEFLARLRPLLTQSWAGDELLVYIDEAHIHQDADLGYGWAPVGQRLWVNTRSPGLSKRVTFYGLYVWTEARVHIWDYERANGEHTIDVLRRLRQRYPERTIRVVWDGASYHRKGDVCAQAVRLGIELVPLPGYSPDLMPVEALWKWLREEVTQNRCHDDRDTLIANVRRFAREINRFPCDLFDRLITLTALDPTVEKLRLSRR